MLERLERSPIVAQWLMKAGIKKKDLASILTGLDAVDGVERRCRVVGLHSSSPSGAF